MTIFNSVIWWGWGSVKVPLNDISTLSATAGDTEATIKWTDVWNLTVNGVLLNTWNATKLVRKVGSAPSDSSDGTLVLTETVADTYSSTWYTDTGLTNGTTYYYKAFSVGSNWLESGSNSESVVPAEQWWHPWADTLIYLPLNSTNLLSDLSGKGNNFTNAWDVTFTTVSWVDSWHFPQTNTWYAYVNNLTLGENRTMCFWRYWTSFGKRNIISSDVSHYWKIGNENATDLNCDWGVISWQTYIKSDTPPSMSWAWHYITYTFEVESASLIRYKAYMDWVLYKEITWTSRQSMASIAWKFYLGWDCYNSSTDRFFNWNLSNFIIENKVWTAQEIADYYDLTKWDYWIS